MNLRNKLNLMPVYVGFLVFVLALFVFLVGVRFGFEYAFPMARLQQIELNQVESLK